MSRPGVVLYDSGFRQLGTRGNGSETEGKKVNYHAGTFRVAENILRDLLAT